MKTVGKCPPYIGYDLRMPNYRRAYVPGGTFFLTIVTHERRPLFADEINLQRLRAAMIDVKSDRPLEIVAAVVLPDHMHFIWQLPQADADFSWRVGRMKALFTKSLRSAEEAVGSAHPTLSRIKHRESDVWQRRFWEHLIRDEEDLEHHANYLHYNPVKHGLVACPHLWKPSSFHQWVRADKYAPQWLCVCQNPSQQPPRFSRVNADAFE